LRTFVFVISCNVGRSIFDVWVKADPESGEKFPANLATLEEQVAAMRSSLEVMEFLQDALPQTSEFQGFAVCFESCAVSVHEAVNTKAVAAVSESKLTLADLAARISACEAALADIEIRLAKVEADVEDLLGMLQ
jgi:hypothetical protein